MLRSKVLPKMVPVGYMVGTVEVASDRQPEAGRSSVRGCQWPQVIQVQDGGRLEAHRP